MTPNFGENNKRTFEPAKKMMQLILRIFKNLGSDTNNDTIQSICSFLTNIMLCTISTNISKLENV